MKEDLFTAIEEKQDLEFELNSINFEEKPTTKVSKKYTTTRFRKESNL